MLTLVREPEFRYAVPQDTTILTPVFGPDGDRWRNFTSKRLPDCELPASPSPPNGSADEFLQLDTNDGADCVQFEDIQPTFGGSGSDSQTFPSTSRERLLTTETSNHTLVS